mmetsp:Transcript_68357/g.198109  ORF Transcript_68357/g.198109 Transcript_68357/m.198109 type:complete len:208 (+) Transcript_68357:1228-1851(+)
MMAMSGSNFGFFVLCAEVFMSDRQPPCNSAAIDLWGCFGKSSSSYTTPSSSFITGASVGFGAAFLWPRCLLGVGAGGASSSLSKSDSILANIACFCFAASSASLGVQALYWPGRCAAVCGWSEVSSSSFAMFFAAGTGAEMVAGTSTGASAFTLFAGALMSSSRSRSIGGGAGAAWCFFAFLARALRTGGGAATAGAAAESSSSSKS